LRHSRHAGNLRPLTGKDPPIEPQWTAVIPPVVAIVLAIV